MNLTVEERARVLRTGMGTENVGPFLETLVKMIRPEQILEIGAGFTTLAMLSALAEVVDEVDRDAQIVRGAVADQERQSLIIPRVALQPYQPNLLVFEDFSVQPSSADRVLEFARAKGWDRLLRFVDGDFFVRSGDVLGGLTKPVDLAWLDAGDPLEDIRFVNTIWPHLAPESWVVMHEPSLTIPVRLDSGATEVRAVPVPVVSELLRGTIGAGSASRIEFIVVPEAHKTRQGGALVIHKTPKNSISAYPTLESEVEALRTLLGTSGPTSTLRLG